MHCTGSVPILELFENFVDNYGVLCLQQEMSHFPYFGLPVYSRSIDLKLLENFCCSP